MNLELHHPFLRILFKILIVLFVSSCATLNPKTIPLESTFLNPQGPQGSLVKAIPLFVKPSGEWGSLMYWASPSFLSARFNPKILLDAGYDQWRTRRREGLEDVQGIKVVFKTYLVPGGIPDLQSGLLLLPAADRTGVKKLTWVIWTKGTDLERKNAPSNFAGSETTFAALLASLGYAVWMPDYVGFGESEGVQTYCVPDSQALSACDGLIAARQVLSGLQAYYQESGRLSITGYSQGGQAAMASAKYLSENSQLFPGLSLNTVYSLSAPLDLMIGAGPEAPTQSILSRPEYTYYLVLGWSRAYPQIKPAELLKSEVLKKVGPLFDGTRDNEVLRNALAQAVGKSSDQITYEDIFTPEYLEGIKIAPESIPYYTQQKASRLDRWVPGNGTKIVLAASLKDVVVNSQNSLNARDYILSTNPAAQVSFQELFSETHASAGGEALLYSIIKIDQEEQSYESHDYP